MISDVVVRIEAFKIEHAERVDFGDEDLAGLSALNALEQGKRLVGKGGVEGDKLVTQIKLEERNCCLLLELKAEIG